MQTKTTKSIKFSLSEKRPCERAVFVWCVACLFAGVLLSNFSLATQQSEDDQRYEQALELARAENFQSSLDILRDIWPKYALPNRYFYDYIAILSMAGQDKIVLQHVNQINFERAPGYVLKAVARAWRNLGQPQLAENIFADLVKRYPQIVDYEIALALVQIDQSKFSLAKARLTKLEKNYSKNISLLHALAYLHEAMNQLPDALGYHMRVLDIKQNEPVSIMQRIMLLKIMGAPSLSRQYIYPGLLSEQQLHDIDSRIAAYRIRWGNLAVKEIEDQYDNTEYGIELMQDLISQHEKIDLTEKAKFGNYFDLLVAYRDRVRMQDVIDVAEKLIDQNVELPKYAKNALCDAYLYVKRAEDAEACYRDVITNPQIDIERILGLYYALLEQEKVEQANEWINKAAEDLAVDVRVAGEKIINDKENKIRIFLTQALSYAFSDHHDLAVKYLLKLHEDAPYNVAIRKELASVYYWRGWMDKSIEDIEIGLHQEPENSGLLISYARVLLDNHEFQKATQIIKDLYSRYPENKHVQRLYKHLQRHNSAIADLDVVHGSSQDGESVISIDTDLRLKSQPLAYRSRVFFHHKRFDVKEHSSLRDDYRTGLGVEYRKPRQSWLAEIYKTSYSDETGIELSADYRKSDYSGFSVLYQSLSDNTPKKALFNNITASQFSAGYRYRWHESRNAGVELTALSFSDDNERKQISGYFNQRWYMRHNLHLWTGLGAYGSQNSEIERPYFNPIEDFSAETKVALDWLTARNYEYLLRQHFRFSTGRYYQKGYGSYPIWSFNYEHQWTGQRKFDTIYGITWSRRAYDGNPESSLNAYLRFVWRF